MYPAGVAGLTAWSLTIDGGLTLRVVESGPTNGAPVLLAHGWGASVYTFRHLMPAIAASGRRAIAFDLRGHGLSDKPDGTGCYTTVSLLADVHGLLDALGLDQVDVIGHSLGGAVALHLTLDAPERVRRLVLAAPVGLADVVLRRVARCLTPRWTNRFARHLVPRWVTSVLVHGAYGNPRQVRASVIDEYWAPSQFPNFYRAVRALLEEFSWQPLGGRELGAVQAPALVILGTADRLIPRAADGAALLANATVVKLEGAGHLGIEECAAEANAAILRFLDRV